MILKPLLTSLTLFSVLVGSASALSLAHEHLSESQDQTAAGSHESQAPHGSHETSEGDTHRHDLLEIPVGTPLPTVNVSIEPDPVGGWNLHAAVTNFEFAPERINQASSPNEGHAHLYINGEKITRLYSAWYHIPQLEPGEYEIRVTLNANGHEALSYQGSAIADTVILQVPEPTAAQTQREF